jgi:hypothetical protein
MDRLGIWGPSTTFESFNEFSKELTKVRLGPLSSDRIAFDRLCFTTFDSLFLARLIRDGMSCYRSEGSWTDGFTYSWM